MKVRLLGAALICITAGMANADQIKKSSSGICHPPASPHYERTTNYQAFDSVEECLDSDGRLPRGLQLAQLGDELVDEAKVYERGRFGHGWADVDGDCQNSRMEALISQSTGQVRFAEDGCRVVAGRWISPFTGQVIHDASEIDIDHVVPLKWAWEHGADAWSQEKRERFANDPVNLWSVELSLNRQKGAKGPEEWLPPSGQCQYLSRFLRLLATYGFPLNKAERELLERQKTDHC